MDYLIDFIIWYNYLVLGYYTVANGVYLMLLLAAVWLIVTHLMRLSYGRYQETIHPSSAPPISVMMAAYNEEATIVESVKSLSLLNYPDYEVVVVNDGSTDSTLKKLIDDFGLKRMNIVYRAIIPTADVLAFYVNPDLPNLVVVDTVHSGKADSLNIAVNVSRAPYFCSVDADSILEKDAILRLMRPIVEEPELVKATGGIVRIVNGSIVKNGRLVEVRLPKDTLSRLQIVEYIRSFLFGRAGLSVLNSLLIISGTFSMFHKKTVQDLGGYRLDTVTEDMEMVVRMHKHLRETGQPYKINFVPDPICWTEAPKTVKMLRRQRRRWHTGLAESAWSYRRIMFNPRYGRIGLFSLPYHFFIELIGPLVEVLGYFVVTASFYFGLIDEKFFVLFLVMAVLVGIFFSTAAILLEEMTYRRYPKLKDLLTLLAFGVLENLGYRQLNSLWRAEALVKFIFTGKKKWEHVEKQGFETAAQESPVPGRLPAP